MTNAPLNIYEQQAANRRNTALVMIAFVLFLGFLGLGFDLFILGYGAESGVGIPLPISTCLALAVGGAGAAWSLQSGARTVLSACGAEQVVTGDSRYQQVLNVVEEMSIASGLPRPSLYVIPDADPNAFAAGKDPEHAGIAVTQGLVDRLSRDELQAVVAHEMSHIRNYDIRTMTVVAALLGAAMLLSEYGLRSLRVGATVPRGRSSRKGGGLVLVLWVAAMVLAPLLSRMLAMAISRQREYLADASAAELTRNPSALAAALEKIDAASEPTRSIKKGTAHLCIADPLGSKVNEREGFLADLFATHPPIRKRIVILRALAYQQVRRTPVPSASA